MVQRMIRADLCDFEHDTDEAASFRVAVELGQARWELDVCTDHEAMARDDFYAYTLRGRQSAARRGHAVIRRTAAQRRAADDIRQWAKGQPEFAHLSDLGRLPRSAIEAAHEQGIGLELEGAAGRR